MWLDHDERVGASLRELRQAWLAHPSATKRARAAEDFTRLAREPSLRLTDIVKRRRDQPPLNDLPWVHRCKDEDVLSLANLLLDETDDLVGELAIAPWHETLRQGLCVEASEGWPAKLNASWLDTIFPSAEMLGGLRLAAISMPRVLGASSFGLALGRYAMSWFEAARPSTLPLCLHEHPRGTRRHEHFWLFASLIGRFRFARKCLDLGKERARTHRRLVARAFLRGLRVQAFKTLVFHQSKTGTTEGEALFEAQQALSHRTMGVALPGHLFAVTPSLDPAAGSRLVGLLQAEAHHQKLVEAFDEDWFRNPRAIMALRDEASRAQEAEPLDHKHGHRALIAHLCEGLG
jgi:hypothetical protein